MSKGDGAGRRQNKDKSKWTKSKRGKWVRGRNRLSMRSKHIAAKVSAKQ